MIYIAAWSGGKDSTYMINKLLERGEPLDEVIFCDTGYEFDTMYEYIEKIKQYWESKYTIKITLLNYGKGKDIWKKWAEGTFVKGEHKGKPRGFPHHLGMSWCTRDLKIQPLRRYIAKEYNIKLKDFVDEIVEYVGIAANEPNRIRENHERYPLVEWGIDEDTIVKEMLDNGLHNPLYNHFHRTGCFTCPKQSLHSLYKLWKNYPKEWETIVDMYNHYNSIGAGINTFKGYTIDELIDKFKKYEDMGKESTYLSEEFPIGCMCK